jgi:hypothetical protein
MQATYVLTTSGSGSGAAVVVQTDGAIRKVLVYENTVNATSDFEIRAPLSTSGAIVRPQGDKYLFENPQGMWKKGDIVGYVKTLTGTPNFAQEEGL